MPTIDLTPEQQQRAQILYQEALRAAEGELRQMAEVLASRPDRQLLGATEFQIRDLVHKVGARMIHAELEHRQKKVYQGSSTACPHCLDDAQFQGRDRPKSFVTLLGTIRIEDRPDYLCSRCHHGFFPGAAALRLDDTRLSVAAEEIVTLAGTLDSFAGAADQILPKMTGLHLGESTVERTTEAVGQRRAADLVRGDTFDAKTTWPWHTDAEGKTCAYLSVDATGVGMQGPDGAQAPGRMVTVGMVYNPLPPRTDTPPDRPPPPPAAAVTPARYLAGFYDLDGLGAQLRRQADAVGLWQAERVIALTDGGNGLEPMLRRDFAGAELILDFWHAAEHLSDLARRYAATTTGTAEALTQQWCHQMKHEGGAAVLATLRGLDLTGHSAATHEDHRQLVQHFENNLPRMDYPRYQRQGWQIGSGSVEAACKTVIGGRLKGAGMRWGEDGADAVSHLRALFLSEEGQWDAFWAASRN